MRGYCSRTPERVEYARRRREEGAAWKDIAAELGIALSTAHHWVADPGDARMKARRASYAGTCEMCGSRTDGSNGPGSAPSVCLGCITWDRESVLAALDDFFHTYSRSPRVVDASPGVIPFEATAKRLFGSWNAMLEAAGMPLNIDRRASTQAEMEALLRAGKTPSEVADLFGWTTENVHQRLRTRGLSVYDLNPDLQRPRKLSEQDRDDVCRLVAAGESQADVAARFGVHPVTIHRLIKQRRPELVRGYRKTAREVVQ